MFPVAVYQIKNETIYYDWSNLQVEIIQDHYHHLRLSQMQRATSYVGRVLHPPLKEVTITRNLIQGSIRDFSISVVKNIPQNKKNIVVCCKKTRKTKWTQLTKRYSTPVSFKHEVSLKFWKNVIAGFSTIDYAITSKLKSLKVLWYFQFLKNTKFV